ncbi:hypothetical protein RB195_023998 [Necator americanus]|uniref:Transthyretin-like family protein n=1 Tax=Necator americanus TaxID=51031 RepID=A0ABR1ELE3_NECAM
MIRRHGHCYLERVDAKKKKPADMELSPRAVPDFMVLITTRTFEGRIRGGSLPAGVYDLNIGIAGLTRSAEYYIPGETYLDTTVFVLLSLFSSAFASNDTSARPFCRWWLPPTAQCVIRSLSIKIYFSNNSLVAFGIRSKCVVLKLNFVISGRSTTGYSSMCKCLETWSRRVCNDFSSSSLPQTDHPAAKSYLRLKGTVIRTTARAWHCRNFKYTPPPVGEYVADIRLIRSVGPFPYSQKELL